MMFFLFPPAYIHVGRLVLFKRTLIDARTDCFDVGGVHLVSDGWSRRGGHFDERRRAQWLGGESRSPEVISS